MSRKLILSGLLLLLLASSCKIDRLEEPIIVPLVDQEFNLDLWEQLSPNGSKLEIQLRTVLNEPCLNTTILSDYEKVGNQLELTIFDILPPEQCQPGVAPAYGSEVLTDATGGENLLRIELQGVVVNSGRLTVTDSYYRVAMESEDGIGWEHYELRRVPAGALWGYVTYENEADADYADDFILELTELSAPLLAVTDGYYGHFELSDNTAKLAIKDVPNAPFQRLILLQYYDQETILSDLVDSFRAGAPQGAQVKLLDYKGNEW